MLCQGHPLRGFDAIHLASGLQIQDMLAQEDEEGAITFATGDDALVSATQARGLIVVNSF